MNFRELRKARQIVILCEGETEVKAVREFINRRWEENGFKSIGLKPIDLRGKLGDLHDKARRYSKEEKNIAVFTLVDLHEFKGIDLSKYDNLSKKIKAAKEWLQNDFENEILDKFYPHLSVHETEAWILADGVALANRLKNKKIKPSKNAEKLDDQNPPKKRLNDLFSKGKRYGYHQIIDGTPLFKRLDFERVYNSCQNFRKFYDDLKSVAQSVI